MGRFDGKVAFITGAARGQGRAHAVRFAEEGADVIALDVCGPVADFIGYPPASPEDLAETAKLVERSGGRIVARQGDVRDLAQVQAVVDAGLAELGGIDFVVANAGVVHTGTAWELSEEQWVLVNDINLNGAWRTLKAAVPSMVRRGQGGSIVITSSLAGLKGLRFTGHYVASKHGLVGLMRSFAVELAHHGIRVNSIHPNGVDTLMVTDPANAALFEDHTVASMTENFLPQTISAPEEVSSVVAWLCSEEAGAVTGQTVSIDFGATLR